MRLKSFVMLQKSVMKKIFEQVKTIKESLHLKMTDLIAEIAKEVEKLEKIDYVLHGKVDIIQLSWMQRQNQIPNSSKNWKKF